MVIKKKVDYFIDAAIGQFLQSTIQITKMIQISVECHEITTTFTETGL